jgi:hypothetical protein
VLIFAFTTVPVFAVKDNNEGRPVKKSTRKRKKKLMSWWLPAIAYRQPVISSPSIKTSLGSSPSIGPSRVAPANQGKTATVRAAMLPRQTALPIRSISTIAAAATTTYSNGGAIEISAVNAGPEPEPAIPYSSDIDVLGLTGVVTQISDLLGVTLDGTSLLAGQPLGGGLNSTLTLPTPLAPSSSINVNFLLGIQQTGHFRFFINVEALP